VRIAEQVNRDTPLGTDRVSDLMESMMYKKKSDFLKMCSMGEGLMLEV
jgi:hypothetical protein